ncbi:hypothetical protein CCMSSC00406_0005700 [Pleurotus cornucopiae]|uniref:Uncharacterized protein n=1 Tax=Pleurotus cornucopiae TaxID=5321 RepID=A0ACB7IV67_PLECO|nr:hypothetical protein CCMSSC00406_0005700 [Pleurotus cornucopiae]
MPLCLHSSLYRAFARPMLLVSEYIAPHPAVFWNRSPARSVPSLGISSCIRVALLTLLKSLFLINISLRLSMARKSTRSRATPRSSKIADDPATPPTSPAVSMPATPRPKRISPRKRDVPLDTPAVQMSDSIHAPPISHRLSFGTAIDGEVDTSSSSQTNTESEAQTALADGVVLDSTAPVKVSAEAVAELTTQPEDSKATPTPKGKRKRAVSTVSPSPAANASPTPQGKRKRARSTVSPSPPAKPLVRGAKKPILASPDELRAARQANPAKRIRPITRFDSDDEEASTAPIVGRADSPVPPAFRTSSEGTPTPPIPKLELSFFNDEAEEDNTVEAENLTKIAWGSRSPSPQLTTPSKSEASRRGDVKKVEEEAESLVTRVNTLLAKSKNMKAKGSPNRSGRCDDPILPDSSDDEATPKHGTNNDGPPLSFPEIPPVLNGIISALESLKILPHLSELLPKYTPQTSDDVQNPAVLHVMGCMTDEYAAVAIYDALHFQGRGVYANPLIANPRNFRVVNKTVMFASESRSPAVFVMPIVVQSCSLLELASVNPYDQHLRLTGWLFDEVFSLFSSFVGSLLKLDTVYAYMNGFCLQFSSRLAKADDARSALSAPNTPQRTSMASMAFKPAGSAQNRARQTAPSTAMTRRYPSSVASTDTVPIYDGRLNRGNFCFTDRDWDQLPSMIRYGVPMPASDEAPDNSLAQDLPASKPHKFVVALVGFTMTTFNPKQNPTSTVASFNIQFSVVLGAFKSLEKPRKVTKEYIDQVRNSV